MSTETWLGLLILIIITIVIWEILKGVYKKVKRKLSLRRIKTKKTNYEPTEPSPIVPTHPQTQNIYPEGSFTKQPSDYNNY